MPGKITRAKIFGSDVLQNAIRIVMEKYHEERPEITTVEALTAMAFARYILDHPEELEDAKKLVEKILRDKPNK
jgi:hypothetical protein